MVKFWIETRDAPIINQLNLFIMLQSFFTSLCASGDVRVPESAVNDFVNFCKLRGVRANVRFCPKRAIYCVDDLVKVADPGDWFTAFIDYCNETEQDKKTASFIDFVEAAKNELIRYLETENGIYYINDWNF